MLEASVDWTASLRLCERMANAQRKPASSKPERYLPALKRAHMRREAEKQRIAGKDQERVEPA